MLRFGHQALLALKENVLAVAFESFVAECFCAGLVNKITVPGVLTVHTVGIIRGAQEVLLYARATRLKVTE